MTYNLLTEQWIPYRHRSGAVKWDTAAAVVRAVDSNDPIVAVASPRADFDAAVTEFLIGLLSTALAPRDEAAWLALWNVPPSELQLQAAFDSLPAAFDVDGDGPRFMQDLSAADLASQAVEPIQDLLLNAKNSGLFIKPGTVEAMGRPAAAMALLTMQAYSTAGGRGYRTSMRGGGPLTTLVDPRPVDSHETTLWRLLWANVETAEQLAGQHRSGAVTDEPSIFPWLAPTRTSAKNEITTLGNVHSLQAYFGMPRRIRLEVTDEAGVCDITGLPDKRMVRGFRGKSYGTNYVGWLHPLSPYYQGKSENEKLPVHPQPGGVGWRDWLSLLYDQPDAGTQAAATVTHFRSRRMRAAGLSSYSVRAFGYDASNAKLRAWTYSVLPEFGAINENRRQDVIDVVLGMVEATELAAFVLKSAVVNALYARSDDIKGDPANVRPLLWNAMEPVAYAIVERVSTESDAEIRLVDVNAEFRRTLAQTTMRLFDDHGPSDSTDPDVLRRYIKARWSLVTTLAGHGKLGQKLFGSLGLVSAAEKKARSDDAKSPSKKKSGARS